MSIQQDLEDIAAMEKKIGLETQKIESELNAQFEEEEYVEARRILLNVSELISDQVAELRLKHQLPELMSLPRTREEESARYLQARLEDRRQLHYQQPHP